MNESLDKRNVLLELIEYLDRLIVMLRLEPNPKRRYASFFEFYLGQAKDLARQEFTFNELRELSTALEGLMNRNFLDYSPAIFDTSSGRFIPVKGAETYGETLIKVSELILELRTLGTLLYRDSEIH